MTITIRKLEREDSLALFPIYSNPNVAYPAGFKPIETIEAFNHLIEDLLFDNDVILLNNEVIGLIGIDPLEEKIGMLGFIINENYWNKGYGTTACKLYINKLKEKGYHTLYADCFLDNYVSQKLLNKLGFEYQNDYLRTFSAYKEPQQCHLYKKELL